jgi:hypothetical protein
MVVGMQVAQPSAVFTAWGNAWLIGHVGLDEAVDAIERAGGPQVIAGDPESEESVEVPLRTGLADLRRAGMSAIRLALPVPGDPLGLCGPPSLTVAAVEVRQAVVMTLADRSMGLVPAEDKRGSSYIGTRWTGFDAAHRLPDVPSLSEADRKLSLAVREATESLLRMDDVSAWRPEIAEALGALRESHRHEQTGGLAPGYPARAHRVAALAARLAVIVELAADTENVGLPATQVDRRGEALRMLDHAVRRARVAACNSVFDPAA